MLSNNCNSEGSKINKQMNKKHIDVITKYFIPVIAGIETNILETYSVLFKEGWDVTIHTSKDTYLSKNSLLPSDNIRGLDIIRYPFSLFGYWPNIDWEKTNLVCLHNFDIFPHFFIILKVLWLKLINRKNFALTLTPHGGYNPEWSIFPIHKRLIKKFYHFTIGKLIINLAVDGIRAVSEWEKEQMILSGLKESKIVVIDNGIEDEAYVDIDNLASDDIKNKVSKFGKYIIQIGRVYPIKNYETTIRALKNVSSDLTYLIVGPVGDEKYKNHILELINQLGLENRVLLLGVIRGVDKYYLIKHAEMMVHMAIWESFCNVVHEGLSQGLPCIVANNTALPFLIENEVNGYCVNTYDEIELANRINFVHENINSDKITEISKNNSVKGLKNSWKHVAGRMNEFYLKLSRLKQ